jgi:hypothetical protein
VKIKLSKSQWKFIGQQAGWTKTADRNYNTSVMDILQWMQDNVDPSILSPKRIQKWRETASLRGTQIKRKILNWALENNFTIKNPEFMALLKNDIAKAFPPLDDDDSIANLNVDYLSGDSNWRP